MTVALPVTTNPAVVPEEHQRRRGLWRRLPTRAKVGAILLGAFVLAAIIGPLLTPYDPSFQNPSPSLSLQPPDAAHLLGTTQSGQDVFSQLLVGIRLTLELALIVGVVATVLSVVVGVAAAYLGGVWDEVLSLATNVFATRAATLSSTGDVSASSVLSMTVSNGAATGDHTLQVSQLATAQKVIGTSQDK